MSRHFVPLLRALVSPGNLHIPYLNTSTRHFFIFISKQALSSLSISRFLISNIRDFTARMEGDHLMGWNKNSSEGGESEEPKVTVPETPKEPLDFLSRSWSLSATEISKALAHKNISKQFVVTNNNPPRVPEPVIAPHMVIIQVPSFFYSSRLRLEPSIFAQCSGSSCFI